VLYAVLVGVSALGLIIVGVLRPRSGNGARPYVDVRGQDDTGVFMIDPGAAPLLVLPILLGAWARRYIQMWRLLRRGWTSSSVLGSPQG